MSLKANLANNQPEQPSLTGTHTTGPSTSRSTPENRGATLWVRRAAILLGVGGIIAGVYFVFPRQGQQKAVVLTHQVSRGNLLVTVTEQGTLESSDNTEIKNKVRGSNTITFVIEGGTRVKKGQPLLKLDTLALDEAISERIKYAHLTRSSAERLKGNVRASELAINEYLEGRFRTELMTLEKELAVAKSNHQKTQDLEAFTRVQEEKGFSNKLTLEQLSTSVAQARQSVAAKLREINVLKTYSKEEELETLKGNLASARAHYAAESERAKADVARRDRALEELKYCEVIAPKDGLVIYPGQAMWKGAPDIEEGATVHKDQILLLMPDLNQMQVKVGVHESVVDRVKKDLTAKVILSRFDLVGKVSSVARVTKPAGWWTGNVVKYDTIIKLPESEGLKPGMSAEVEIILAEYKDIITVPVAAVVQTPSGNFCWIQNPEGDLVKLVVQLGDTNDILIQVKAGLKEGDVVVLNPLDHIEQAQAEALRPSVAGKLPGENEKKYDRESETIDKKNNEKPGSASQ